MDIHRLITRLLCLSNPGLQPLILSRMGTNHLKDNTKPVKHANFFIHMMATQNRSKLIYRGYLPLPLPPPPTPSPGFMPDSITGTKGSDISFYCEMRIFMVQFIMPINMWHDTDILPQFQWPSQPDVTPIFSQFDIHAATVFSWT